MKSQSFCNTADIFCFLPPLRDKARGRVAAWHLLGAVFPPHGEGPGSQRPGPLSSSQTAPVISLIQSAKPFHLEEKVRREMSVT